MSRTYTILTASEADNINYNDVVESSASTLRWNNPKTRTFVKWDGSRPTWIPASKTVYTNAEILAILNNPDGEWYSEPETF